MLPPPSDGAAHSGNGLGHHPCSTPTCTAPSPAPTSIAIASAAPSGRRHRGNTTANNPIAIATRYGHRSHKHSAHGTSPMNRSEPNATPNAPALAMVVTSAALRWARTLIPPVCGAFALASITLPCRHTVEERRMRQLLGRANSSNVMKVIWLLEEMHLDYDRQDIGGKFGGNDKPDYLALNPNGVIPTLVEDDFVLWESNVILRYLAGTHAAGHRLWPQHPRARADIDRWMDWQQTTLQAPMSTVFWGVIRTPPADRDPAAIAKAAARLGTLFGFLDARLATHRYIVGDDLTLADIPIGVHTHRWFSFDGIDRPAHPHLRAWYDRLLTRPAYKDHVSAPPT